MSLEHEVEIPWLRQLTAALGAFLIFEIVIGNLICSEATLAILAIYQGVGEILHMSRSLPHPGMHHYRSIETDNILVQLSHLSEPKALEPVL